MKRTVLALALGLAYGIAQGAEVSGTVFLIHEDHPGGKSVYKLMVHTEDGKIIEIKGAVDTALVGKKVIVRGTQNGSVITPKTIEVTSQPMMMKSANLSSNATVLVLPAKYSDNYEPFSTSSIRATMAQVAQLYSEMSYGQQTLTVTVPNNWLQTNMAKPTGCDYGTVLNKSLGAYDALGADKVANYGYIYIVMAPQNCSWLGLGYIGYGLAVSNGNNYPTTYTHELGHNFGLMHAGSLLNGYVSEYGDPYSAMGNQTLGHFNAAQKAILGWIVPAQVKNQPAGTASYTLNSLENPGGSVYAVKVTTPTRAYWIEERKAGGVQVRLGAPLETTCSGCVNDTEFLAPALQAGQVFADANITVTYGTVPPPPPPGCPPGQTGTPPNCVIPPVSGKAVRVQSRSFSTQLSGSSWSLGALATPPTPGNLLVLTALWAGTVQMNSVDGWTMDAKGNNPAVGQAQIAHTIAGTPGSTTLRFASALASNNASAVITEYSGVNTLDSTIGAMGGGMPTLITQTVANNGLGVMTCTNQGGQPKAGQGWTMGTQMPVYWWGGEEFNLNLGPAGTQTASMTTTSGLWACALATFR